MNIVSALRCNHPKGTSPVLMDEGNIPLECDVTQQLVQGEYHAASTYTTCSRSNWAPFAFRSGSLCAFQGRKYIIAVIVCPFQQQWILWLCRACQFYLWRKQEYQESPTNLIQMLCPVHLAKYDDRNYCLINDNISRCQYHTIPSEQRRHH